jgi:hypothetical protein
MRDGVCTGGPIAHFSFCEKKTSQPTMIQYGKLPTRNCDRLTRFQWLFELG